MRLTVGLFFGLLSTFISITGASPAAAQQFQVIHSFTGGIDGAHPQSGVMLDATGSLYVTTTGGGDRGNGCTSYGCGVVVKLTQQGSSWMESPFYTFQGGADGSLPDAGVVVGPNGTLYGTTSAGGEENGVGYGTVFNLRPEFHVCGRSPCSWTETVLHRFAAGNDGWQPGLGKVVFDAAGNIYGTTMIGGSGDCGGFGCGTVYKLTRSASGWTESVAYSFTGDSGGAYPQGGLIFDQAGNMYGTATSGGVGSCNAYIGGCGVVYRLSPSADGWTETVLYSFTGSFDGGIPAGGLIFGPSGVLYGTTESGGLGNGTVFELRPSGALWTLHTLYSFRGRGIAGSTATLTMDANGTLYGTTLSGPPEYPPCEGSVFALAHSGSGWFYTLLHCFTGGEDGGQPYSPVTLDNNNNLFGTTYAGGASDQGVVWEIKR